MGMRKRRGGGFVVGRCGWLTESMPSPQQVADLLGNQRRHIVLAAFANGYKRAVSERRGRPSASRSERMSSLIVHSFLYFCALSKLVRWLENESAGLFCRSIRLACVGW